MMPLTQEKRFESGLTNNNDHNYLHKKFKKMASTVAVFPTNTINDGEARQREENLEMTTYNTSVLNITATHPEIKKNKVKNDTQNILVHEIDKNVQININENTRLSDVNTTIDQVSGKTSFTDEFCNKTENLENDFNKDALNGGTGGRYICPYCKLSCAKPSVLQKHIRAHTNERPYPCVPCGFAFKTKSNLYKHRRSRTHALRLQGADESLLSATVNDDEFSGESESDTSLPATSVSDTGSDASLVRIENLRPNEFSSPELVSTNDCNTPLLNSYASSNDSKYSKAIYKPKFRAALYKETDEKDKFKKNITSNADFLNEHISKIISDNEAIVDVIETPLQKKYGKIKQIAESKQFFNETYEIKSDSSPLNLTKNSNETENTFRKRSHSESFSQIDHQKHPLNPEGSIIKDLLLKNKTNGLSFISGEAADGFGSLYICPLCQIAYRSADNLEIHRLYYCKGNIANNSANNSILKDLKTIRSENAYVRSNSINVRLPESQPSSFTKVNTSSNSPPPRHKPDNLVIIKPETNDVIAPLPSPGPLLGNTRLVDTRTPEYTRKNDTLKTKSVSSPKRRIDARSETYSPRLVENISPRSIELYSQPKMRCIESNSITLRSMEEMSQHMRHNSTSLQMFGGEVKIVDHSGSTTTLRIEPSKNQLSPIMIQQNLSPSKLTNDAEASSVVVRSGLHSGGTIVHNPPTPKETVGTPQPSRISISTSSIQNSNIPLIPDITHFQFPPLSAITAYNPLTLPPLSPSSSPNGATTILHGGKLIPHVPGMPGPNSPGVFVGKSTLKTALNNEIHKNNLESANENVHGNIVSINIKTAKTTPKYDAMHRSIKAVASFVETEKHSPSNTNIEATNFMAQVPIIKVKNVDEPKIMSSNTAKPIIRQDGCLKRNSEGVPRTPIKDNKDNNFTPSKVKGGEKVNYNFTSKSKTIETKLETEIRNFNFENLITKAEIYNNQIPSSSDVQKNTNPQEPEVSSLHNERSETAYFQKSVTVKPGSEERKPKFLRPSTLPLKPGTFTPKRHHGITPNANTMPLVSPETPRPAKAYGQLYLNGNAYTYLGLKCSTKAFYCTINRPQPTYVPNQHFLSMYSNWQLLSELTPDPLGLSASSAMSLYDSRHRPQNVTVAVIKQDLILTHSSQWNKNSKDKQASPSIDSKQLDDNFLQSSENTNTTKKELTGGFESNEEYTYVRGRGRGRYVCSECGIRCKKPSMLKKHIRTHTDVRPYTCIHCAFSFKTKGNLTKHMKSKAHYKKCCELGINPTEGNDIENGETAQCSGETDDDTESEGDEGNEGETESSDTEICKSRLPEHEAAHCLLSLGGARPATSATPGLITSARPSTYPYNPAGFDSSSALETSPEKSNNLRNSPSDSKIDGDNEPMDLSKNEMKINSNIPEIPTARESSVLASLASNTAKLPQHHTQWTNGEPMLHTYLTERALLDSKIKQSQLTSSLSKLRKVDLDAGIYIENETTLSKTSTIANTTKNVSTSNVQLFENNTPSSVNVSNSSTLSTLPQTSDHESFDNRSLTPKENTTNDYSHSTSLLIDKHKSRSSGNTSAENAKQVVSEYIKQARINLIKTLDENTLAGQNENVNDANINIDTEEKAKTDELNTEPDTTKLPSIDHDLIARKVVIGAGGVAFKVSKGKEYEGTTYSPGRLMEDGRRVCDFCNKTFTKPSQLRLHLNIHYMERPFRCSACAVSFRTRGHLQKHERSGSHHNKVSMTSTFGAATSLNPRPFRCSDCNIAFRIHGHLAKHLRSKMHVMRLECLFKLPFGTFTEIERAGVSLTDIDTTDCASSLASLQSLARKLHEKDPSKLEYREGNITIASTLPGARESSEDEDPSSCPEKIDMEKNSEVQITHNSESQDKETKVNHSATDN